MKCFIGIDGGGTKTDYVLCDENGFVINKIKQTGSNPGDVGMEKTIEMLTNGCLATLEGKDKSDISAIFAGLSGGGSQDVTDPINLGMKKTFSDAIIDNQNDAYSAMASGIAVGDGIVVISGTGSIGYGRHGKEYRRVGGWGHLIDKGGSGYDYGRDVIYYALMDRDGRGQKTILTEMLLNKIGDDILSLQEIYKKGKPYIASFALMAFEAFRQGDEVAKEIMDINAKELSKIFNTLAQFVEIEKCPCVLAGSIFKDFEITKPFLEKYLKYDFEFIRPTLPPVYGSCVNAALMSGIKVNKQFEVNFEETFK